MTDLGSERGSGDPADVARRTDMARALAALPPRQREVAVFRYYLDLDIAEIATILGIPEGTVRGALHRARRSLARSLADDHRRLPMSRLDEEIRRDLNRLSRPVRTEGVLEHVAWRRASRRIVWRIKAAGLATAVIIGSVAEW